MNILVTGANGFIGKNLIADLKQEDKFTIMNMTRESSEEELNKFCSKADFVYHLAGVNRPEHESEFMEGNHDLTKKLFNTLKKQESKASIVISSSIQAEKNNPYGESKKAGEELAFQYEKETGNNVFVYRLPNVFGKWCKPNYNSAVATFCYNISRDLPVTVSDESLEMNLVYIDDVIQEFKRTMHLQEKSDNEFCEVKPVYQIKLGQIVEFLESFNQSRADKTVPNMNDSFTKKLYSTYLSYLPEDKFNYDLKMNVDNRGSFTEFIKTPDRGQVSINISKPGITKGNHWHHTKNEKFLVVSGEGVIRFRKIDSEKIIEYYVSEEKFQVIDIPSGYTHNIENIGKKDMVTVMWANEIFDPEKPDTFNEEV